MTIRRPPFSAMSMGLLSCHCCGLVSRIPGAGYQWRCPRCGTSLHRRKPHSLQRTWALLLAAYVLFIPANTLPIMETGSLFGSQKDTIMSGVLYLWHSGSWSLAALVFFASILVPLAKLVMLTYLLFSVQRRAGLHRRQRTQLYRVLEFIGRWSMLDIYVVTLLSALVQLQGLATILPKSGAMAFGAVVVLTMLAAMTFDPRLIWDEAP
ncbi:MAG: paraquat-inducible protein A [Methylococcaceae bacterium]|jgi:paraquat-inducible protein A